MKILLETRRISIKHFIYLVLLKVIDLSEFMYMKLKYIKCNYKSILINMFEEKDYSTSLKSVNKSDLYMENKYIKSIIVWLSSLFGSIEEEEQLVFADSHRFEYFIQSANVISDHLFVRNISLVVGLLFMFFFYYFFT